MTETEWLTSTDPLAMLKLPALDSSPRNRRLFVVACCRRVASVMTDQGNRAVLAAENFADGAIDHHELHDAWLAIGYPKSLNRSYAATAARAAGVSPGNGLTAHGAACALNAAVKNATSPKGSRPKGSAQAAAERAAQATLLRDIFGNPFRPIAFSPDWRTDTAVTLARQMYESRDFSAMPILADALQDAGCDNDDILSHCRSESVHVRGCWVVDLLLGKT